MLSIPLAQAKRNLNYYRTHTPACLQAEGLDSAVKQRRSFRCKQRSWMMLRGESVSTTGLGLTSSGSWTKGSEKKLWSHIPGSVQTRLVPTMWSGSRGLLNTSKERCFLCEKKCLRGKGFSVEHSGELDRS